MQGKPDFIAVQEGRTLFGADPWNYDAIRPPYPEELYEFLVNTGALRAHAATLEIGAGNGLATRQLIKYGAAPLTVVEPDARFAPLLAPLAKGSKAEVRIIGQSFEEAALPRHAYDLVAAATSFHWIQPSVGLAKVAEILKPGGYAALWWNIFGDREREDPYHEATQRIMQPLSQSPSGTRDTVPYALRTQERLRDFAGAGEFEPAEHAVFRWTLVLNTEQVGALYATFSPISRLPAARRDSILKQLMDVAEKQFGGVVERNMVSPIYVAKRKPISTRRTAG